MKKLDFIVIAGLLILCLCSYMLYNGLHSDKGAFAVVSVDGVEFVSLPLSIDTEMIIPSENGFNLIKIFNGEAFVTDASCRDRLCINHKAIKNCGEAIICLPNKVIIEITGSDDNDIDALVY